MTPFEETIVLNQIIDCIKCASMCGGKVFGGFVRDVIVPRLHDSKCKINFKDVAIWFKTEADANNFIMSMGRLLEENYISTTTDSYPGAFNRQQYNLLYRGLLFHGLML